MNNVVELKSKRDELLDRHFELMMEVSHISRHILDLEHEMMHHHIELSEIEKQLDDNESEEKH